MKITSDDPRLTAYVLDELDKDGRNFIENEMQSSNESRLEARDLADFTGELRAALATEPVAELGPKQERAIEARFKHTSWIPYAPNWLLKAELTALVVMALWFVPIPFGLAVPARNLFEKTSLHAARVMLRVVGTPTQWRGSSLVVPRVSPMLMALSSGQPEVTIDFESWTCTPYVFNGWVRNPLYPATIMLAASLLAGSLYLRSPWRRLALAVSTLPFMVLSDALSKFYRVEWFAHMNTASWSRWPLYDYVIFSVFPPMALFLFLMWMRRSERKRLW